MNEDQIFEQWKQKRRDVRIEDSFADRIMARIDRPSNFHSPRWLAAAMTLVAIGSAIIHLAIVLFFTFTVSNQGI
ncbi:MAG TPA: hypothetical protein VG722_05595 [Tepidisphaeraceae bacterium]|nr:hypothetical protein [Tepidisphaeraceae bacterium]